MSKEGILKMICLELQRNESVYDQIKFCINIIVI